METQNTQKAERAVVALPLDKIVASPYQVRADGDEDLRALADDMGANGLIQPVTVRRAGKFCGAPDGADIFELVAGHRRRAAARMLGWETIPAVVVEATDAEAEAMLVAENFARRDLTPLEMADTAAGLVKRHGAAEAAKICGKSERWAQRMAYIAGRLSPDWRTVARAWEFSQASLEAVARNCASAQAEVLAGILKGANAQDAAALAAMAGRKSIEELDGGGNPHELEQTPGDGSCWLSHAPWIDCGLPDCDGCERRSDCLPLLDGEEPDPRNGSAMVRCTDRACFKAKMKEWMGGRGLKEWSKKCGAQVAMLPRGLDTWRGEQHRSRTHTVPLMMPSTEYSAGRIRWFDPAALEPKKGQKKEKAYPTEQETRDTAFCETVRDWLQECNDIPTLNTVVVALALGCKIGGRDVWGTVDRLRAADALPNTGIADALREEAMHVCNSFLWLPRGRTGHTAEEMDAARALADVICGGDTNALEGLRLEADHLASKRIEAIAEAKKAARRRAKK